MKKKKKIAFYIGSLTKAGAQRVIINLTGALLTKGHQVVLVTTAKEEDEYFPPQGAIRIISDLTREETGTGRVQNFKKRFAKLRNIWKKEKPDVVISFIGKNNIMAILTAFGLNIPVLVSVRGEPTEEYYSRLLRICARQLFPLAAGIILQTEDSKAFFPAKVVKKAVVLPNPLNPAFLKDQGRKGKEEREESHSYTVNRKKTIIMVGRIDANKNQKLVIDSFGRLAEDFPDCQLEIWGEGDKRQNLISYVEALGLEGRICLPGATGEVKEKLEAAQIYVLSSNTEGMPNSLMEAMALGLPVISTDCPCGGPKMLIDHGENGLLVPVKDVEAMTEAIRRLLEDEDYAHGLGRKAMEIGEKWSPEEVNRQWEEYILSCCK